jgi:hypothetical protein
MSGRKLNMLLNQKPFHVYWYNPSILVFKFDNLSSTAARMWSEQCLLYNGKYPDPLRLVYDFVDCGPPSPFWMKTEDTLLPLLRMPTNLRTAYLIRDDSYRIWTDVILKRRKVDVGPLKAFTQLEQAAAWLMEGLDEIPNQELENKKSEE